MTMTLRALVVDDESPARRRLSELLDELGVEVVGEAADGVQGLELARERQPDVLFLDISMPEVDGFDVARHLADPRPLIVFQTAYSEFAVKAFEHEAVDYLVKPVTRERLAEAVDRAARRMRQAGGGPTREEMMRFGTAIGHVPSRPERMLVRQGAGHRLLPVAEIERFSSDEGLIYAHAGGAAHATDYTLNELEARFAGVFVRASRADLVSIRHVAAIASNGDGSATLTLASGARVHVSRRRAAGVRGSVSP